MSIILIASCGAKCEALLRLVLQILNLKETLQASVLVCALAARELTLELLLAHRFGPAIGRCDDVSSPTGSFLGSRRVPFMLKKSLVLRAQKNGVGLRLGMHWGLDQ